MELIELIRRRRSERGDFRQEPIAPQDMEALVEAARWAPSPFNVQPWEILFVTDPEKKAALGRLTRRSIAEQFKDSAFLEAVAEWMRLDEEEWRARGDGVLLADHAPDSSLARALAPLLLKHTSAATLLGKLGAGNGPGRSTERLLVSAPLVAVLFWNRARRSPGDGGETWALIGFGAMLQNFLLAATERNIGAQFVNAALERPEDRTRVRALFGAPETHEPLVILRLGYLDPAEKRSVRLPHEQIVRYDSFGGER